MSIEIETPFGPLRKIERFESDDGRRIFNFLWKCPVCQTWGGIDDQQVAGAVSIDCASNGGKTDKCTYHETHDFRPHLPAEGSE